MLGEVTGSYKIVRRLGEGGMGVVYTAEHSLLGSPAVVKMLKPEFSQQRDIIDRFFNEAKAATRIKHPGIVKVFDFGFHEGSGSAFIVMELLEGESLNSRVSRRRLDSSSAAVIARQVASVLAAAHNGGIIHRDLKPDNVFLVPDPDLSEGERAKVLDFGIAKLATSQSSRHTRTGDVFGTPAYMSPEQCRDAADVDARTDIYALGCITFEMLTGRPPFVGGTIAELVTAHLFKEPLSPSSIARGIAPNIERAVMRALSKKPEDRQQSMAEFAAELASGAGKRPGTPMPVRRAEAPNREAGAGSSDLPATLLTDVSGAVTARNADQADDTDRAFNVAPRSSPQPDESARAANELGRPEPPFSSERFRRQPKRNLMPAALAVGAAGAVSIFVLLSTSRPSADRTGTGSATASRAPDAAPVAPRQSATTVDSGSDRQPQGSPTHAGRKHREAPHDVSTTPTRNSAGTANAADIDSLVYDALDNFGTAASECYEGDVGDIDISLTIEPDGHATNASFSASLRNAASIDACLKTLLRTQKFPRWSGQAKSLKYSFHLGCNQTSCIRVADAGACCASLHAQSEAKAPTVELTRDAVSAELKSVGPALSQCFRAASKSPSQVQMAIKVAPSGVVSLVTFSSGVDGHMSSCLRGVLGHAEFPKSTAGGMITYVFSPTVNVAHPTGATGSNASIPCDICTGEFQIRSLLPGMR